MSDVLETPHEELDLKWSNFFTIKLIQKDPNRKRKICQEMENAQHELLRCKNIQERGEA